MNIHKTDHGAVCSRKSLVLLPPYSPELTSVERLWLYLREGFLSLRIFRGYNIPRHLLSLLESPRRRNRPHRLPLNHPWIAKVNS